MPPPPPITRREQLELDELLSDIYRGIETLPDKSCGPVTTTAYDILPNQPRSDSRVNYAKSSNKSSPIIGGRAYVREYELPSSSPLVRQHKQEVAALRGGANNTVAAGGGSYIKQQPGRSTLKRQTTETPPQSEPQSLASFLTSARPSTTPEGKRRVRIVDPYAPAQDDDYADEVEYAPTSGRPKRKEKVKYVNTNKFIYHQEQNPDDDDEDGGDQVSAGADYNTDENVPPRATAYNNNNAADEDEDDIDGVTRVEYYHTSWLDRQLGRASKRRSSKELNERQVKEKAMIEELKRSLKNGAITLRQSFKGNSKHNKHSQHNQTGSFDDHSFNSATTKKHPKRPKEQSSVFGSGLATIPRNYNFNLSGKPLNTLNNSSAGNQQQYAAPPTQNSAYNSPASQHMQSNNRPHQQEAIKSYASKTLPHKHLSSSSSSPARRVEDHQLLQSHYRGGQNRLAHLPINQQQVQQQQQQLGTSDNLGSSQAFARENMRNPAYSYCGPATQNYGTAPNRNMAANQQHQQQPPAKTISGLPSATEVVRSALSRSSSQVSLNQLNKTINSLPSSPQPHGGAANVASPTTPTQQLKAASPSLSPSPIGSPVCSPSQQRHQQNPQFYSSKTLGHQQRQTPNDQIVLTGTRTIGRPPQTPISGRPASQQQQQQQPKPYQNQAHQPVYANPHASLMQHRMEQQAKQSRNAASVREFNELDSLLRSLSPGSTATSTHITPGFSSKPSQPSFGGFMPAANQQTPARATTDIYARVQKEQVQPQQQQQQQHRPPGAGFQQQQQQQPIAQGHQQQPYVIDVTNKKEDENCRQRQNLSEFEPPIELLPSMEDYQNISKLNPVKNHHWYKPFMSRDKAISLLKDKPQGTFIVRDSTTHRGSYGLAVKVSKLPKNVLNNASLRNSNGDPSAEFIRHFLIEPTGSGVRLSGYSNEPVFDNLPDLIYQHSLTEIALPCKLVIPRADIEDPKFNQKQKHFYDEFIASKEQAKHMPYERTSPDGGYRRYPGDVYVHNEHRIIFE